MLDDQFFVELSIHVSGEQGGEWQREKGQDAEEQGARQTHDDVQDRHDCGRPDIHPNGIDARFDCRAHADTSVEHEEGSELEEEDHEEGWQDAQDQAQDSQADVGHHEQDVAAQILSSEHVSERGLVALSRAQGSPVNANGGEPCEQQKGEGQDQ